MSLKLFVFDMAGTTVKDEGVVLAAFLDVAAANGLAAEPAWITARMGWDKATVFRELLQRAGADTAPAARLAAEFQAHLAARYEDDPPRPIPGVIEAFRALAQRDIEVAFTTGFARATADLILDHLGWSAHISVASDEVDHGRPAPDLLFEAMRQAGVHDARAVGAAGDTPSDLLAGFAAGCGLVIGVGTGSHTLDELEPHPHTHLLPDLSGLADLIDAYAP
ncbi:MAG: HAD hydrolase-like protein [Planctomycetota bacterium]